MKFHTKNYLKLRVLLSSAEYFRIRRRNQRWLYINYQIVLVVCLHVVFSTFLPIIIVITIGFFNWRPLKCDAASTIYDVSNGNVDKLQLAVLSCKQWKRYNHSFLVVFISLCLALSLSLPPVSFLIPLDVPVCPVARKMHCSHIHTRTHNESPTISFVDVYKHYKIFIAHCKVCYA